MLGATVRRFATSAARRAHYEEGPGKDVVMAFGFDTFKRGVDKFLNKKSILVDKPSWNIPFSVENKWRLLAMMAVFFGSGFAFPFIIVRHQLLKK